MSGNLQNGPSSVPKKRHTSELILILLLLLSVVGIALTDFSPTKGFWYWMAMGPLFCGAAITIEWSRMNRQGESKGRLVWTQIFHWFGYLITIYMVFILSAQDTGRLNNVDVGLVALLILAFATFTAGITASWRISVVGVFLGIAVVAIALLEEYIWALLIPLALIIIGAFLFRRRKSKKARGV
jgi:CDP-diglyceride synthetase